MASAFADVNFAVSVYFYPLIFSFPLDSQGKSVRWNPALSVWCGEWGMRRGTEVVSWPRGCLSRGRRGVAVPGVPLVPDAVFCVTWSWDTDRPLCAHRPVSTEEVVAGNEGEFWWHMTSAVCPSLECHLIRRIFASSAPSAPRTMSEPLLVLLSLLFLLGY